jgi:hypothetical protein
MGVEEGNMGISEGIKVFVIEIGVFVMGAVAVGIRLGVDAVQPVKPLTVKRATRDM